MFGLFKNTAPTTQKITPTVLMSAMDSALEQAFGAYVLSDADELIAKTGKSRSEVLSSCLSDDEVAGCIEDIESAIKGTQWRIYDDVAHGQTGVSPELINKFYKVIRRHIKTFARLAITTKLNGYALGEYVYAKDQDGFIYIDKILDKDGELDRFDIRRNGEIIYQSATGETLVNTKVKMLVLTHKACGARPKGEMSIVKIYPAVLLRARGWAYASQFIARYAQPYVVGKQGGYSLSQSFTAKLFEFINGGATGIGSDDDINIHQLNGTGEAFLTIEQLANKRIQKFLLGRVKTSELSIGSRSAQETDDKVRQDRIGSYLELMVEAVQHAIDAMLAVNQVYGTPINATQGLWFEYLNEQDVDINRATRDKLYVDTGQITLTKEYMIDMVGLEAHHFVMTNGGDNNTVDDTNNHTTTQHTTTQHDDTAHANPSTLPISLTLSADATIDELPTPPKDLTIAAIKPIQSLSDLIEQCNDYESFATVFSKIKESNQMDDSDLVVSLANNTAKAFFDGLNSEADKG